MEIHGSSPIRGINRHLDQATKQVEGQFAKLASGRRINQAADDASGLGRSEQLRAMIESLDAAGRNAGDGVSMVRTAEADLGEIGSLLGRMREIGVQAANGTLSDADRANLDAEFSGLRDEVDRIAASSEFNGTALLDGSTDTVEIQVGPSEGESIAVPLSGATASDLGLDDLDLSTGEGASAALGAIDEAIDAVSERRSELGAAENRLSSSIRSLGQTRESLIHTESGIGDADLALETALLAQERIFQYGAISVLTQANISSGRAGQLLG
jgi:flagellin